MGILVFLVALVFPRIALAAIWLLDSAYLRSAFDGQWLWPVAGFVFLPLTTLAYAFGNMTIGASGHMEPISWLLVAFALIVDLGAFGSGTLHARRRQEPIEAR